MIALFDRGRRLRPAVEPAHPLAVGPQDMHEGAMDRVPERPAVAPPFGIAEPPGRGVKPLVHLGIVSRHRAEIGRRDHAYSLVAGGLPESGLAAARLAPAFAEEPEARRNTMWRHGPETAPGEPP